MSAKKSSTSSKKLQPGYSPRPVQTATALTAGGSPSPSHAPSPSPGGAQARTLKRK